MKVEGTSVDAPDAAELLTEYFRERADGFPGGGYRVSLPDPVLFEGSRGCFLLARADDGTPLGCGGIKRLEPETDGRERFEVKHLYVRPVARGTGTGRRLLAELESRAAAHGAAIVVLDTNISLTAAGHLYRSSGYSETAPYNDNPNATHWFRKELLGVARTDRGWSITVRAEVSSVRIDHALTLDLSVSAHHTASIRIESAFRLVRDDEVDSWDGTVPRELGRFARLIHTRVSGIDIAESGAVTMSFESGERLMVEPDAQYESFSLNVAGWLFVGLPGEGVGVWSPPTSEGL